MQFLNIIFLAILGFAALIAAVPARSVTTAEGHSVSTPETRSVTNPETRSVTTAESRPVTTADGRPVTTADGRPVTTADGRPVTTADGRSVTFDRSVTTAATAAPTLPSKAGSSGIRGVQDEPGRYAADGIRGVPDEPGRYASGGLDSRDPAAQGTQGVPDGSGRYVQNANLKYNVRCHDMKLNITDVQYCINQISNQSGDCEVDPNLEYQFSCSKGDVRLSAILWKDHSGDYKGVNKVPCFSRRAPLTYLLQSCGSRGGAIGSTQADHDDTVLWIGNEFVKWA